MSERLDFTTDFEFNELIQAFEEAQKQERAECKGFTMKELQQKLNVSKNRIHTIVKYGLATGKLRIGMAIRYNIFGKRTSMNVLVLNDESRVKEITCKSEGQGVDGSSYLATTTIS